MHSRHGSRLMRTGFISCQREARSSPQSCGAWRSLQAASSRCSPDLPSAGTTFRRASSGWLSQCPRDGRALYVEVGTGENSQRHGGTAVLPIGANGLPTQLPISVLDTPLIPHPELNLSIGSDPSVYAFVKWETHRNIYRIPLHN